MAAYLYTHWCFMPGLASNTSAWRISPRRLPSCDCWTPLGMTYEEAKKRAAPYDKIVGELPEMRAETVDLVRQAVSRRLRVYVLVNNRTEGNAPFTIQALVDALREEVAVTRTSSSQQTV